MLTKTNSYSSFFTAEESKEIISELEETVPSSYLPACFGVKTKDIDPGTGKLEPWTDLLLSLKQFIEDRLDIELECAWLYSNLGKKKPLLINDLNNGEVMHNRSFVFLHFPPYILAFRKKN